MIDFSPRPAIPIGNTCADDSGHFGQIIAKPFDPYESILTSAHFNGSILVRSAQGNIYEKGFGIAQQSGPILNNRTTRFRLGSLTKQFTATAILSLVDKNKIALNASICTYIEDCPIAWTAIRVDDLLHHASGIPNFTTLPTYSAFKKIPTTSSAEVASFKSLPLHFQPGSKFEYSNTNYVILGYIVERVSGQDLGAYLETTFFVPQGLTNTGFDHQTAADDATEATGFKLERGRLVPADSIDMTVPGGAGSFYSTIEDLSAWITALRAGLILSSSSTRYMFTPQLGGYGCGWFIQHTSDGHVKIEHSGIIDGFADDVLIDVRTEALVIVLSNVEGTPSQHLANSLMIAALSN